MLLSFSKRVPSAIQFSRHRSHLQLCSSSSRPFSGSPLNNGSGPTKEDIIAQIDAYNRDIGKIVSQEYGTNEVRRNKVRVRYAPSPTGMMHIGGLRTFLYNYLFTKMHGGDMILRIEDTDQNREVAGSVDDIINMLKWSGMRWDEGPGSLYEEAQKGQIEGYKALGPFGPYY
jgi:hypothetical protein